VSETLYAEAYRPSCLPSLRPLQRPPVFLAIKKVADDGPLGMKVSSKGQSGLRFECLDGAHRFQWARALRRYVPHPLYTIQSMFSRREGIGEICILLD
jgi:hypothetical protein